MLEHSDFTQSLGGRSTTLLVYIEEPVNSGVVEFCVVLTSVTNLRDIESFWPVHSYWI